MLWWEVIRRVTRKCSNAMIKWPGKTCFVLPCTASGMGYLNVLLEKTGTMVKQCRCYRDPLFGGGMPEPTGKTLGGVCDWIKEKEGRLGLALDGDADRFGIIDDGGVHVTPNQFLPLLYHHLITVKGLVGPVTRTVATTHMLDRIARRHGQEVYETAVDQRGQA